MTTYKLILYYEQPTAGIEFKFDENIFDNYDDAYKCAIDSPAYFFEIFKLEKKKDYIATTLELRRRKWLPKWFIEWQQN